MRRALFIVTILAALLPAAPPLIMAQDEPPLPAGLGGQEEPASAEPALPAGLGGDEEEEPALPSGLFGEEDEEPGLPAGLDGETGEESGEPEDGEGLLDSLPFSLDGFLDVRAGVRLRDDPYERDMSLGEGRLQLEIGKQWDRASFDLTTDLLYDQVASRHDLRPERGEGWLDLREVSFSFTPTESVDVKVGRQILTWGTGDLLFINDLFPKDWNSFFAGRDEEYLKAPSDAVKGSWFSELLNVDVVYTPRFDSDRFIDGRRMSFWNGNVARRSGRDMPVRADIPDDWFDDDEIALRLYGNVDGTELALYGYHGFWKSPGGQDPVSGRATFPELSVIGASARGNVAQGIGNVEAGYYSSNDDGGGGNPMIRNSEFRFLAGYEQEIWTDFTAGVQYYLEWMMDHGDYRRHLPAGARATDEHRHVATLRLTQLLMEQNLTLSLFTFWSPSDEDLFSRPKVHYRFDDNLAFEVGANFWYGEEEHTFFGQFDRNTNAYVGVRYSF